MKQILLTTGTLAAALLISLLPSERGSDASMDTIHRNPAEAKIGNRRSQQAIARPSLLRSAAAESMDIVVVSGRTEAGIEGATVQVGQDRTWADPRRSGPRGHVTVPASDAATARVSAPGYAPTSVALNGQLEQRVELQQAGSVALRFLDSEGAPVSGIVVSLVPPMVGLPWVGDAWQQVVPMEAGKPLFSNVDAYDERSQDVDAALPSDIVDADWATQWTAMSDDAGLVRWDDLPPRAGYRWGVRFGPHLDLTPARDTAEFRAYGETLRRDPRFSRTLSGPIHVRAGEIQRFEVATHAQTTVAGTLDLPRADLDGTLTLSSVRLHRTTGRTTSITRLRALGSARVTSEHAAFRFGATHPGPARITGTLSSADGQEHYYVAHEFEIHPGANDLGVLSCVSASSATFVMELPDAGSKLPVEWQDAEFPLLISSQGGLGDSIERSASFRVHAIPGEPITVHGLDPARVWSIAAGCLNVPSKLRDGCRIERTSFELSHLEPRGAQFRVPLKIERLCSITVACTSAVAGWENVQINIVPISGTGPDPARCRERETCAFTVTPGEYAIYAHSDASPPSTRPNVVGSARCTVRADASAPQTVTLELVPSCSLELQLPQAIAGETVHAWYADAVPTAGGPTPVLSALPNQSGLVRFPVVLPGASIVLAASPDTAYLTGAAGTTNLHIARDPAR